MALKIVYLEIGVHVWYSSAVVDKQGYSIHILPDGSKALTTHSREEYDPDIKKNDPFAVYLGTAVAIEGHVPGPLNKLPHRWKRAVSYWESTMLELYSNPMYRLLETNNLPDEYRDPDLLEKYIAPRLGHGFYAVSFSPDHQPDGSPMTRAVHVYPCRGKGDARTDHDDVHITSLSCPCRPVYSGRDDYPIAIHRRGEGFAGIFSGML